MGWINLLDKKILLIDDEKNITNLIEEVLLKEGFKNIIKAHCGADGMKMCKEHGPDAVVLDIMLPDVDGLEVCKRIREFSYCPILFLSSKNDDIDKILGLSTGGDDYITKPFSPRELAFRIKAQLRRQQYNFTSQDNSTQKKMNVGNIVIDVENSQVYKGETEVSLTAKEYQVLLFLAENPNKIISKERICENVWGDDYIGYDNTIMVHIRHLREKIEDDSSNPKIIVTVIGLGYKLVKRDN